MSGPTLETTPIPGLVVVRLDVRSDDRGWFKENWQREKMIALGLPDFDPIQHNVAFNEHRGTTRGIHTEPWDKFVSVTGGRVFGAWVDMREGESFGTAFHIEIDPGVAVFVPRGVGNSYQTLDDRVGYTYLVNEHWRPTADYPALDLADPDVAIPWPIPLAEAITSGKDLSNPRLGAVVPSPVRRILVTGGHGQLGRALGEEFPEAELVDLEDLDLTDPVAMAGFPWHRYSAILNAAAYTAVDVAETPEGRVSAWDANALVPAALARIADSERLVLVHYSSDYVFDGTQPEHHEEEVFSPLSVYGQSKAAGDIAATTAKRHYVLRASWVVGEGKNFVRTMQRLAADGVSPQVVSDQVGRLTFAHDLARATRHLIGTAAPYGTYNMSSDGPAMSWADVAKRVFEHAGRSAADVTPVLTADYVAGGSAAPRPASSVLSLGKIQQVGFVPPDGREALDSYLRTPQDGGRGQAVATTDGPSEASGQRP